MKLILKNASAVFLAFVLVFCVALDVRGCPDYAIERVDCDDADVVTMNTENYRNLNMTVGRRANDLRFTWQSTSSSSNIQFRPQGASTWEPSVVADSRPMPSGIPGGWHVHQLRLQGLSSNTTYEYRIRWTGGQSDIKTFRTGGSSTFSFFVVADPQLSGTTDAAGWANTMAVAGSAFPDANFIISLGDQVSTGEDRTIADAQLNFNRLFAPSEFHRLPLAPVPGNHDAVASTSGGVNSNPVLWHFHYNTPTDAGHVRRFTLSGRDNPQPQFDYYFRYGNVLFLVIAAYDNDTYGGSSAARAEISGGRRRWFRDTINDNADAEWRVVAFHQPAYAASRPTTETGKQRMRDNWVPIFEESNIDIAFAGHEHIYSRTHHMRGGTPRTSQTWESQSNNAVRIARGGTGGSGGTGITHITFGSPSGFNLRQPTGMPRSYLATHHQAGRREFSVVNVTPHTFSVATYMINGEGVIGNSITMTDIYTIVRPTRPTGTPIPQLNRTPRPVSTIPCEFCNVLICACPPAVYDMQRDPNWGRILSTSLHPVLRGISSGDVNIINSPRRELHLTGRTGTSQGVRVRANVLLSALTHQNSVIQIQYSGRLSVAGSSQIRFEESTSNVWLQATSGSNHTFIQTITLTRAQLQQAISAAGGGDITLAATPAAANLTITNIRITEIAPVSDALYDMQSDTRWADILSATAHPVMRGTSAATSSTVNGPPRELRFTERNGTSQGLRIRANVLLNALTGANSAIRIEYTGRLGAAGSSQIRVERNQDLIWLQPTTGSSNTFSQTVTLTRAQLQQAVSSTGEGDITLGATPGTANLTITGIRITEVVSDTGPFYDMQVDGNWSDILSATAHSVMRGTGSPTSSAVDGPPRELRFTGRTGTSQGLRIRASALRSALPPGDNNRIQIEYTGRLSAAGASQIRMEQTPAPDWVPGQNIWTQNTTGSSNTFSQTITLSRAQLNHSITAGTGDITLGATPDNANLTITNIRLSVVPATEPDEWTVTFALAGGTRTGGGALTQRITDGGNATPPTVERAGYVFHEWDNGYTNITSDLTITAVWEEIPVLEWDVIFELNGGTHTGGGELIQTITDGGNATPPMVVRAGHTFIGWQGIYTNVTSDRTITAQWEELSVTEWTVTFEPAGGTHIGGGELIQVISNGEDAIPPTVERDGYIFDGWDGIYTNITSDRTITAQWTKIPVVEWTVAFALAGGTRTGGGEVLQTIIDGGNATPPTVERDGYYFAGWNGIYTNVTSSRTIIAQWSEILPDEWTVTFELNYGTLVNGELVQIIIDGNHATPPTVEREGYTFDGWDGEYTNVTNDRTITAQWTENPPDEWTVTFNLADGVRIGGGEPIQVITDGGNATPPTVERDGYTFAGWDGVYTNITSDRTITAQWIEILPDEWTVTFDLADGVRTGGGEPIQVIADGGNSTPPIVERDGYTFDGWDGVYTNITSDRTITAQWTKIPPDAFKITFDPNGGAFVNHNDAIRFIPNGDNIGILPRATPLIFSKNGYRFTGWFEDIGDESTRWRDNYEITEDITLYARWTQIPDPDFHVGDVDGDGRITSADATRLAMHLIDQNVSICLLSADISGRGYVSINDVTLFARWLVGHNVDHLIAW